MSTRSTVLVASFMLVACGGGGGGEDDTSTDQPADTPDTEEDTAADSTPDTTTDDAVAEVECSSDGDCDDGNPCTVDVCDLDYDTCSHDAVDADGDGYPADGVGGTACAGGTDCDDSDGDVHPDAALDCAGGGDFDCDGDPDDDEDGDGYVTTDCGGDDCDDTDLDAFPGSIAVDCSTSDHDCNLEDDRDNDGDGDARIDCSGGGDCDDADPAVSSLEDEANCDGLDTDCDGEMSLYEDADQDGFAGGDCAASGAPVDCDDDDDGVHPGAPEGCEGTVDNDCDGDATELDTDADGDGFGPIPCGGTDCDDAAGATHPGAPDDGCDLVDANCDGETAEGIDDDRDGWIDSACTGLMTDPGTYLGFGDCDDTTTVIHPEAYEGCDGTIDNDCDGDATEMAVDSDDDGWAPASCGGTDCDDADAATYPGAPDDGCDLVDRDCDGSNQEHIDDDHDGWIDEACDGLMTDPGTYYGFGDCNDSNAAIPSFDPLPDNCDGVDKDCDGADADPGVCDDSDVCTTDTCNGASGCGFAPIAGCCNTAGDCNDGDACTADACGMDHACTNVLVDADDDGHAGFECGGDDCDDGDGGVWAGAWYDPATGYVWQNPYMAGVLPYDQAVTYCSGLSLCGHGAGQWHLPTIGELRSFIRGCPGTIAGGSCGVTDTCLGSACESASCAGCALFGGPSSGCYWDPTAGGTCTDFFRSSSSVADDPLSAWIVNSQNARVDFSFGKASGLKVRCVHTGS